MRAAPDFTARRCGAACPLTMTPALAAQPPLLPGFAILCAAGNAPVLQLCCYTNCSAQLAAVYMFEYIIQVHALCSVRLQRVLQRDARTADGGGTQRQHRLLVAKDTGCV